MKKHRKFFAIATQFLPVSHERYREMCSLAAVGQLGGPQMCDLNEHIASCDSCRAFLQEVAQASVQFLPVLAEENVVPTDVATPAGMRARFLSRLAKEADGSCQPSKELEQVKLQVLADRGTEEKKLSGEREEDTFCEEEELVFQRVIPQKAETILSPSPRQSVPFGYWRLATVIAATAVIGITGFLLGRQTVPSKPGNVSPPAATSSTQSQPIANSQQGFERLTDLDQQRAGLQRQLTDLRGQLVQAKAEQDSLRSELAAANARLTSVQQVDTTSQRTPPEALEAKNQIALLESETGRLRQRLADSEVKLTAQQRITEQVSEKLQTTEANLQQELSLKEAKSQMGELVAARNLHIVDVYDADPNGRRQRAFGRVFYEEGKSLVFYAYDLDDPGRHRANVVFHVWGGKASVKEVTHSLGILQKDEGGESRWAMTFDDPKVLAQINSVFVTAESAGKHSDEPRGKKVLYAYFGSAPNHP
jgi:hypothetical protein